VLSIIIPALNEEGNIEECLKSLDEQDLDRSEYEILVVDGDSTDRTREIACIYADKVILQRSEGIGGARRDGVEASKGDILVFTDADTVHDRHWLRVISENLKNYDVSTGPILFYHGNYKSNLLRLWRKIYILFHLFDFYWLIGSNMAIRREVYQRIGGHSNISILEDFDISVKTFKEGDVLSKYDKNQRVCTSARRLNNLFTYFLIYAYGHYNYHLAKNFGRLQDYPAFDRMDLKTILNIIHLQKINNIYTNLRSRKGKQFDIFIDNNVNICEREEK